MIYKFAPGAKVQGVKAQTAGEELARIREENGLTAPNVLDAARPEVAPLHPAFEWDDSIAAEEYRLVQARQLIKAVHVVIDTQKPAETVRAFVRVEDPTTTYETIQAAMTDDNMRWQVVSRALKELNEWRDRYYQYKELAAVFSAIDETEKLRLVA